MKKLILLTFIMLSSHQVSSRESITLALSPAFDRLPKCKRYIELLFGEISKQIGIDIRFMTVPSQRAIKFIKQGSIDGHAFKIALTPEEKEFMYLTKVPLFNGKIYLYSASEIPPRELWKQGSITISKECTACKKWVNLFHSATYLSESTKVIEMVARKRTTYGVAVQAHILEGVMNGIPIENFVELSSNPAYIALHESRKDLDGAIAKALNNIRNNKSDLQIALDAGLINSNNEKVFESLLLIR